MIATLKRLARISVRTVCTVVGLGLVMAAFSGVARADDPLTPEINPSAMFGAIALLIGGALLLTDRVRSKQ